MGARQLGDVASASGVKKKRWHEWLQCATQELVSGQKYGTEEGQDAASVVGGAWRQVLSEPSIACAAGWTG